MTGAVRRPEAADVEAMAELVAHYARQDQLLPRSPDEIRASLDQWLVTVTESSIVAVGSLVPYSDYLVELRSLAVAPEQRGRGLGGALVDALAERAAAEGYDELFALTRAVDFFGRSGFHVVGMERFPQKVWTDCSRCPLREQCDETPMVRYLRPASERRLLNLYQGDEHGKS